MATGKIGHYTIVSELGRGGMGVVYKAHEESLNRYVAIKVLGEQLSGDPSFVTRFVREAQAAAALSHPNIIQVNDLGKVGGEPQGLCVLHCFEAGGEGIALRLGLPETAAVLRSLGVATRVLRSFGLLGDGRCVDSVVLARLRGVQAGVFDAGIGVRGDGHVYPSVFGVGILMSSHVRRRTVADRNCTCVMRSAGNS